MAVLQCEICGGKLIGEPGGIFECDSCGVEYSTEWAKAKVQEIRGTVKIEGPVRIEGAVTAESLMKRGHIALGDGEWKKADEYFDKALDIEPENGDAYAGKLCAERHYRKLEDMAKDLAFPTGSNYKKAWRYADEELKGQLKNYTDSARRIQKAKQEEKRRKAEEKRRRDEVERQRDEAERQRMIPILAEKRKKLAPVAGLIVPGGDTIFGLRADDTILVNKHSRFRSPYVPKWDVSKWSGIASVAGGLFKDGSETVTVCVGLRLDGTVQVMGKCECSYETRDIDVSYVSQWRDITAIAVCRKNIVGLRADGTVLTAHYGMVKGFTEECIPSFSFKFIHGFAGCDQCDVSQWKNIVAIAISENAIVGLQSDGTVQGIIVADNKSCIWHELSDWKDIVAIAAGYDHAVGLRKDGTVVSAWYGNNNWRNYETTLSKWRNIVAVAVGVGITAGLRSDGTVLVNAPNTDSIFTNLRSRVSKWTDIVAITVSRNQKVGLDWIYGLRSDGMVCGDTVYEDWKLFNSIETLEHERKEGWHQKKISDLKSERNKLRKELAEEKSWFFLRNRDRVREIESRLARIEAELKNL